MSELGWVNTLIFNKLSDICPSLSLNGQDRRVFDICRQDFKNYLFYIKNNYLKIETTSTQELSIENAPIQEMPLSDFFEMIMEKFNEELYQSLQDTNEVSEFLDMWVSWWWRKWTERTKVIINKENAPKNLSAVGGAGWLVNGLSSEERSELMEIVISRFIKYGEICCTQIMAESLIKKAVEEMKTFTIENKIQLISKLQRQVKAVSYTHGVLVFIRPDNYFKFGEWRNDGVAPSNTPNKVV